MILYLDTSALVKIYIEEAGSPQVKHAMKGSQIVSTSRIAYVEARAGMARKFRQKELSGKQYRQLVSALDKDWNKYYIVEVSEEVTRLGAALVDKYPLRGFDAIHLASGILLKQKIHSDVLFSCFDRRLKTAAHAEGLVTH